ncbi:MAG: glycosyltransferase family 9 protein, partial [Christiangramia sp.]
REEYPKAELHYLIYDHTYPVVQNNPNIDKFILFNKKQSFSKLAKEIRTEKYEVVIDVLSNLKTAILTGFSGAEYRISYDKFYTRPVSSHVFSRKIQAITIGGAAIEKRLRMLSPLSCNFPAEIKPKIYLEPEEIKKAKQKLENSGIDLSRNLYMIGALGSSEMKTYPLEYLATLLDQIVEETNANLLFNYIPNQKKDVERLYEFCKSETQKNIHLDIYGNSLREFLSLTSHCDGLIGNEGGAVNMAKALEIPTFAIFSPPLNKENWNMYEDGEKNVSVHLRDFKPELFKAKPEKQLKTEWASLYEEFHPEMIQNELRKFLKTNSK